MTKLEHVFTKYIILDVKRLLKMALINVVLQDILMQKSSGLC